MHVTREIGGQLKELQSHQSQIDLKWNHSAISVELYSITRNNLYQHQREANR